ncbi:outer membrane beta-barrel family protein [Sediminibacterium ginsengisoli]|uniref:Outer membrane receptor proteins, mostly Fe transport n=1 Tax=Sediminibacterium ginsengisoli TaxID=413434 RepID=A0A1T4KA83_9BACT|nr:outer membrane beta-barrel family protein [Sediminibacterium ginsengisoli]SJZ39225.1 Outer membrane receptor proteins, mostly Fe transport [Sediminibacterium ginsengisoli]
MNLSSFLTAACLLTFSFAASSQTTFPPLGGTILNADGRSVESASVHLLKQKDSSVIKIALSDKQGRFQLEQIAPGKYLLSVSYTGHKQLLLPVQLTTDTAGRHVGILHLQTAVAELSGVTVTSKKPLIEFKAGRTIVNIESAITNVGATALEILEKSPGVSVDKSGVISLKGRQNVLILVDDKPSYLSGEGLIALLNSLPASQLEQLEIMTNPPAKYDATGSTGIINIKTKKTKTKGLNGNLAVAYGQGRYYKSNNSFNLNYRNNRFNVFLSYALTANRNFTDLYAYRTYQQPVLSYFEQFSYLGSKLFSNTGRGGVDYFLSDKTSMGISFTGLNSSRDGDGRSPGQWMNAAGVKDSSILSTNSTTSDWKNHGGNIYLRHAFSKQQDISVDLDYLAYRTEGEQFFNNTLTGTTTTTEISKGVLPADLVIFSGKADYTQQLSKGRLQAGWKSALVNTDNIAAYSYYNNGLWEPDAAKTNHFVYKERIHALYLSASQHYGKWELDAGLRFEYTDYDAEQKGNTTRKDSAFSRQYGNLFPTAQLTYKVNETHSFSFSAGKRIDRPAFQKLNPFVYQINKYTYQKGNPFFRPQYTWNFEVSHQYKQLLTTTASYGITTDYFSQVFLNDTSGIIVYTEGNLGSMKNLGLSVSTQLAPAAWWSLSFQASINHRIIEGTVYNRLKASLTQANLNLGNQFRLGKGWAAELSGFFNTSQQELQEITEPTGQAGIGISKQVLKNKGSLKLNVRDLFYTQAMNGNTTFQQATEYFRLKRDTRVVNIAFSYRFGKTFKDTRKNSGISEEIRRVSAG